MVRRAFLLIIGALAAGALVAGPIIDRTTERGYMLSMPLTKGSEFRKVGLLVALPGKGVKARLERDNWAFACEQNGFALINLEVNYDEIQNESHIDELHDRIQATVKEVMAGHPSIEKDRIFIGGTSRGGMAAMAIALRHPTSYNGVGVAAGAMMSMGAEDDSANAKGQYFFFAHGDKDKTVPMTYFDKTLRRLSKDGAIIETHLHRGAGHNLDKKDYAKIVKWMSFRMGRRVSGRPGKLPVE